MSPNSPSRIFCTPSCRAAEERLWLPICTMRLYLRAAATICLRLEDVVRARLLDVHVLARLAGPDGLQRVPVVRGGDGDRVDVLVVEHLADVAEGRDRLLVLLDQVPVVPFRVRIVDVDQRGQLDVRLGGPRAHVAGASSAAADHRDPDRVIGTVLSAHDAAGSSGGRAHKEVSSIHPNSSLFPGEILRRRSQLYFRPRYSGIFERSVTSPAPADGLHSITFGVT